MRLNPRERFEDKFVVSDDTGCWAWCAAKSGRTDRYKRGSFSIVGGKTEVAARVSWQIYRGEIPRGMQVLHQCDNPLCVNPDHLFLGNHADNMADMKAKRRSTFGERSAKAVLTANDVRFIRECDAPHTLMAKQFGVSYTTIFNIRAGKAWPNTPVPPGMVYKPAPRSQSEATKEKLRAYWQRLPATERYSTNCIRGHPLAGDNLGPNRKCRACGRMNRAESYARQRAKKQESPDAAE
jgi:hypothetical protein